MIDRRNQSDGTVFVRSFSCGCKLNYTETAKTRFRVPSVRNVVARLLFINEWKVEGLLEHLNWNGIIHGWAKLEQLVRDYKCSGFPAREPRVSTASIRHFLERILEILFLRYFRDIIY